MSKCMVSGEIDLMGGKEKDWEMGLSKITQTSEKLQSLQTNYFWNPFNMLLLTRQMFSQSK